MDPILLPYSISVLKRLILITIGLAVSRIRIEGRMEILTASIYLFCRSI